MKKKIMFMVACVVLLLLFTSIGYGGGDGKYNYILLEHPWERLLSPKPDGDRNLKFVVLAINPHLYAIFTFQPKAENLRNSEYLTDQKLSSTIKRSSLNKDEKRTKK